MKISNFSITPAMFVPGDEVTLSLVVRAERGDTIGDSGLMIWAVIPGYGEAFTYHDPAFKIAIGESKTVSVKTALAFGDHKFSRGDVVTDFGVVLGFYGTRTDIKYNITLLDAWYKPAISAFAAERSTGDTPNDEGENMLVDIALKCSAAAIPSRFALRLYYQSKAQPDKDPEMLNLTSLVSSALAAEIRTVVRETLVNTYDWDLVLWFGDQYESASSALVLSKSFANVHLSGASTGGVCFGGFSKATDGNPLFDCYYPTVFHAGVRGANNYAAGEVDTGNKWIDGRRIYRRVVDVNVTDLNTIADIDKFPDDAVMINLSGYVIRSGAVYYFPPVWYLASNNYHAVWMEPNGRLVAQTSRALTGHLIVEYVKANEEASV